MIRCSCNIKSFSYYFLRAEFLNAHQEKIGRNELFYLSSVSIVYIRRIQLENGQGYSALGTYVHLVSSIL